MRSREDVEWKVYSASGWIEYSPFTINIPRIGPDDISEIIVFVWLLSSRHWRELPRQFGDVVDDTPAYILRDGEVTFLNCQFHFYKIMVMG